MLALYNDDNTWKSIIGHEYTGRTKSKNVSALKFLFYVCRHNKAQYNVAVTLSINTVV